MLDGNSALSDEYKQLVRASFKQVEPIAEAAAAMFYGRLFELDPTLRSLFKGDMKEQGRKLMSSLKLAVGSLDRLESIVPAIEEMGARHAGYGVKDAHYGTVAAALLWTLEKGLGDAFTPQTRDAWTQVYGLLAEVMKSGAAKAATQTRPAAGNQRNSSNPNEDDMSQNGALEMKLFRDMVEDMPINVMTCDLETFRINYLNGASKRTLKQIEALLPIKADAMLGQTIDIFHKNPRHQRNLLADPKNLPYQTVISVGDEKLDLLVTAICDERGKYVAPMLTWSVITEKVKLDADSQRLREMVENMPINVMLLNPADFTITYVNRTSVETLRPLQKLLPVSVDSLVGQTVDIFHKNPRHQRSILADPNNLPHRAEIKVGDETLDLLVSAVRDKEGKYIAAMLTWNLITSQVAFAGNVRAIVDTVAAASTELQSTAEAMTATAEQTSSQAGTVASASEQLTASIGEISQQVTRSATIAKNASEEASRSNTMVQGLAEAATKIGKVVDLINDIASQTNLLALNATIEAARAGEAGKGFAVVAAEVKNLANQTAKATEEIANQIGSIQSATKDAVTTIQGITTTIGEINEIASAISAAVEEQGAATQEVTSNVAGVNAAADETGQAAGQVLQAAKELSLHGENLRDQVDVFLKRKN